MKDDDDVDEDDDVGEAAPSSGGRNLYVPSMRCQDFLVKAGSFIKVNMEDADADGEVLGVCAVLAISAPAAGAEEADAGGSEEDEEETMLYVKWFAKPSEICMSKKKL
jgi:hypothetical protein